MACRFGWCETPADMHSEDPSYHTRELGFGMLLAVNIDGQPITNWMPDWGEWWIDSPEEIDAEYEAAMVMLRELPRQYREFREALVSDPLFAGEVAAVKAKDAREMRK